MSNWDKLTDIASGALIVLQIVLWAIFLYYIIISTFAWVRRKEAPAKSFPAKHKFAMLIAAHNEEAVISGIIKSLKKLNYPNQLYDIFVIADNCTDNTAEVARGYGAKVYERFDDVKRGKGFSLEWMFAKVFDMEEKYDAVCVLDADNLVSSNFLLEMNKQLSLGHKVVQGYLDSKNPYDTWVSGNNSIAFWISNRLIQLPRYYLGLSCVLGGTGFIVATDILKEIGWEATSLTEDLEFSMKLIMKDMKVYWAHDAVIFDEKPLKMAQSWRQRKRWMQGHFDCVRKFFGKLLVKSVKERNFGAFDGALYLIQPVIVVINGIGIILGMIYSLLSLIHLITGINYGYIGELLKLNMNQPFTLRTGMFMMVMIVLLYLSTAFVIIEGKLTIKIIKYLVLLPLYNLTWVPIIIRGFMDRNKREWSHTVHTRVVDISEVEALGKAG